MPLSTQEYANLSKDAYNPPKIDEKKSKERGHIVYSDVTLDGIKYKPLAYMDNPATGYQGTVYQREDTGEIVAAHRGTEPTSLKDLAADAAMVFQRVNPQLQDAEGLTRRAFAQAQKYAQDNNVPIPEVTITGHSLGGTLAQLTAHKFGLHAETFNPYGAVSLQYGVPANAPNIVNNVMAADPINAASPQPGQTRLYASAAQLQTVSALGYANDNAPTLYQLAQAINPVGQAIRPGAAAVLNLDAHLIGNFANVDDQGRPHASILSDPQAQQRAAQYEPMFQQYREDVRAIRSGMSWAGDLTQATGQAIIGRYENMNAVVNLAGQQIEQGGHMLRQAGQTLIEGAQHATRQMDAYLQKVDQYPPQNMRHATPAAGAPQYAQPLDPRHPSHPEHDFYQSVRDQLETLTDSQHIELSSKELDNCAAAMMAGARHNRMREITDMDFPGDGDGGIDLSKILIYQDYPNSPIVKCYPIDINQAVRTPIERSFEQFEQNTQALDQSQQRIYQQMLAEFQSPSRGGPSL